MSVTVCLLNTGVALYISDTCHRVVGKNGKVGELALGSGTSSQDAIEGKCWKTRKHTTKLYRRESFSFYSVRQSLAAVIHSHSLIKMSFFTHSSGLVYYNSSFLGK